MFELTTKNADGWKSIIGLSFTLNDEAVINVTSNGLDFKVMAIDSSGLVDFEWKKENMIDFKCDQEQKIAFRTEDFNKILKRASGDDKIKISYIKDGIMTIKIGNTKFYDLNLVNTDGIRTGATPKLSYDDTIIIPHEILKEKVDDMIIVSDFVQIDVDNGKISFSSSEIGNKATSFYENESIKVKENVSAEYSLSHLENVLKCIKSGDISLNIKTRYPLAMTLTLPDVGEIKYYLAPHQKT